MTKPKKTAAKKAPAKSKAKTTSTTRKRVKATPEPQTEPDEPKEPEHPPRKPRRLLYSQVQASEYDTKDIHQAFRLLEREGKISLYYCLGHGSSGQGFYGTWIYHGGPQPFNNERNTLLNYFKSDHPNANFGYTFHRSRIQWSHIADYEACLLKAEADEIREDYPEFTWKKGDVHTVHELYPEPWAPGGQEGKQPGSWQFINGPFHELLARWSQEYVTEVERVAALFPDHPELGACLANLHKEILDFAPGSAEGKVFIERLDQEQRGRDVLKTFRTAKDRLVASLATLTAEHVSVPDGGTDKIVWTEQVDLFGYLFTKLADAGIIRAPMKREAGKATVNLAKYGEQLSKHFTVETKDGRVAKDTAVRQSVKPSAHISKETVDRLIAALQQEK